MILALVVAPRSEDGVVKKGNYLGTVVVLSREQGKSPEFIC